MKYRVLWSRQSKERLKKIDKKWAAEIIRKVLLCAQDPFLYLKRIKGSDTFRLRVGDFRVIMDVDSLTHTIYILTVGYRKNIYESKK